MKHWPRACLPAGQLSLPFSVLNFYVCHGAAELVCTQFGILGEPLSPVGCLEFCFQLLRREAGMTDIQMTRETIKGFSLLERLIRPRLGMTEASRCITHTVYGVQAAKL